MIKKKVNSEVNTKITNEVEVAQEYIDRYRYIILNEFMNHMRLNYKLSYKYEDANNLLLSLGLKRKRIAFENEDGIKQSKNEFINDRGVYKHKPIVGKSIKKEEIIEIIAKKTLYFIKDNFSEINFTKGIYNFNMFNTDEGVALFFDNKTLKQVLRHIGSNFSYEHGDIPAIASKIRKMSEPSYIRENTYGESSIRVEDKQFYKYQFGAEE